VTVRDDGDWTSMGSDALTPVIETPVCAGQEVGYDVPR
jgi:hypothetical protein